MHHHSPMPCGHKAFDTAQGRADRAAVRPPPLGSAGTGLGIEVAQQVTQRRHPGWTTSGALVHPGPDADY